MTTDTTMAFWRSMTTALTRSPRDCVGGRDEREERGGYHYVMRCTVLVG